MRADKTARLGVERLLTTFVGEMQSLNYDHEDIVRAVMEVCDPDMAAPYQELKLQMNHMKEITSARY
jgi:hypothetical protein